MAASFHGHSDIVRMLTAAEAEIDKQDEVCCSYCEKGTVQHDILV